VRTVLIALAVAGLAAAAPAHAATRTVRLVDHRFVPATVTVRAGDTVAFRHAGQVPHTATSPRGRFASPLLRSPGDTFRHRTERRGTFPVLCTLHPGMRMTLRVR
jgi:plastocyanin